MKILISPAKSLDFDSTIDSLKCTQPVFLNKTSEINSVLKEKSPKDLMQLQGISQKISDLNWKRNNDYVDNHNNKTLDQQFMHLMVMCTTELMSKHFLKIKYMIYKNH